jgi:hypothetical protein
VKASSLPACSTQHTERIKRATVAHRQCKPDHRWSELCAVHAHPILTTDGCPTSTGGGQKLARAGRRRRRSRGPRVRPWIMRELVTKTGNVGECASSACRPSRTVGVHSSDAEAAAGQEPADDLPRRRTCHAIAIFSARERCERASPPAQTGVRALAMARHAHSIGRDAIDDVVCR